MSFSQTALLQQLQNLPAAPYHRVAYSGGRDSHVLLHAMVGLRGRCPAELWAVHVNHGLHPQAAAWAEHCRRTCDELAVPIELLELNLSPRAGESLEAVARGARYRALAGVMGPGDLLLTAHHQDDQAETLVLQLLRGSGPGGLAAMPLLAEFPPGYLARPLLDYSRDQLADYARRAGFSWIEDPSNRESNFDRNFLRREVFPVVRRRWPGMGKTLARSARHCAEAQCLIDQLAWADLRAVGGERPDVLSVSALRGLQPSRCRALLRRWFRELGSPVPDTARLDRVLDEVLTAARDRSPRVHWEGAEVRRYRDGLYLLRPLSPHDPQLRLDWDGKERLILPIGLGVLEARIVEGHGVDSELWRRLPLQIGFRRGGERCRPAGQRHTRSLKSLLQESGVVPWMRDRIPLVFLDGRLAAVADLWVCEGFHAGPGRGGVELCWGREVSLY